MDLFGVKRRAAAKRRSEATDAAIAWPQEALLAQNEQPARPASRQDELDAVRASFERCRGEFPR